MKRIALALCLAAALNVSLAQQPATNPQQQELEKQATAISLRMQLNYQKLSGLQEFQDYLNDRKQLEQLQQQYQALSKTAPKPAEKPAEKK